MKQTEPPIAVTQDTPECQQLLAATHVLYAQAKNLRRWRLTVVVIVAILLAVSTLTIEGAMAPVGLIGGLVLLGFSFLESKRADRLVRRAMSVQEKFDTRVFDLAWNDLAVPYRATGHEIHQAAAKFRGEGKVRWYRDTRTVVRPLDVLICQQSNLGWGADTHRRWASVLVVITIAIVVAIGATWFLLDLDIWQGTNALAIPALPVIWEAIHASIKHFGSADEKESVHQQLLDLWQKGLARNLPDARVREVQDRMANLRVSNAPVPDWFNEWLRPRNEQAMQRAVDGMIDEARRHGRA